MTATVIEEKQTFIVDYWTLSDGCASVIVEAVDLHEAERIAIERDECFCQLKSVSQEKT